MKAWPTGAVVAASFGSTPVAAPRSTAASVTLRAIGPAASWLALIGMTPARLHNPSVGLILMMLLAREWQTIEPSVVVPTAANREQQQRRRRWSRASAARVAIEDVGTFVWPLMPLQPLDDGWTWSRRPAGGLADDDRAGGLPVRRAMKRVVGSAPGERPGAAVVGVVRGGVDAADDDRDAEQRPVVPSRRASLAARVGRGPSPAAHSDHRVERRVELLDAMQIESGSSLGRTSVGSCPSSSWLPGSWSRRRQCPRPWCPGGLAARPVGAAALDTPTKRASKVVRTRERRRRRLLDEVERRRSRSDAGSGASARSARRAPRHG